MRLGDGVDEALPLLLPVVEVLVLAAGVVEEELPLPLPLPLLPFPELPLLGLLVPELLPALPFPLPFPPALPLELGVGAAATIGGSVVLELGVGTLVVVGSDVEVLVGFPEPTTGTDVVFPDKGTWVGDVFDPPVRALVTDPDRETVAVVADPAGVAGIVVTTSASFARTGTRGGVLATTPAVTTEAAPTAAAAAAGAAALLAAAANWPAMDSA